MLYPYHFAKGLFNLLPYHVTTAKSGMLLSMSHVYLYPEVEINRKVESIFSKDKKTVSGTYDDLYLFSTMETKCIFSKVKMGRNQNMNSRVLEKVMWAVSALMAIDVPVKTDDIAIIQMRVVLILAPHILNPFPGTGSP